MVKPKSYSKPKPILILIPGNPGIAEYYKTFTERLDTLTFHKYEIHTINYSGFSLESSNNLYSIQEELDHTIDKIQNIINNSIQNNSQPNKTQPKILHGTSKLINKNSSASKIPIILLGHSIGAWIAQEIDKREDLNFSIQKIIYIFPFFHKDPNSKLQKFLESLLNLLLLDKIILLFYSSVWLLPKSLLNRILSPLLKKMNQNAKDVTWKYFIEHKHILKSIFFLARTEFKTLHNELLTENFDKRRSNMFFLYNTDDLWAPISAYNSLLKIYPKEKIDLFQGSIHDFCTTEEGIDWVSGKIFNFLNSNH